METKIRYHWHRRSDGQIVFRIQLPDGLYIDVTPEVFRQITRYAEATWPMNADGSEKPDVEEVIRAGERSLTGS